MLHTTPAHNGRSGDLSVDEQIVRSVTRTLDELVLPAVTDPWAASYLRSSISLLALLSQRLQLGPSLDAWETTTLRALSESLVRDVDPGGIVVEVGDEGLDGLRLRVEQLIEQAYGDVPAAAAASARTALATYRAEALSRHAEVWRPAAALDQM